MRFAEHRYNRLWIRNVKPNRSDIFFAGRLWDGKLLSNLEELTNSNIKIENTTEQTTDFKIIEEDTIRVEKIFKSYDGENYKKIIFSFSPETLQHYKKTASTQLISNIIFVLVIIGALTLFLFYTIVKPIKLLSESIVKEDFTLLAPLSRTKTEFSHLAGLIHDYYEQKKRLIEEISKKNTIEVQLRLNETKYRTLFENMVNGLSLNEIIFDSNGKPVDYRILEMNSSMETMLRIKSGEMIGKTVNEVNFNWSYKDIKRFGEVAVTGNPISFEVYFDKLNKYFHVTAFSPKKLLFAIILEDINERKNSELALK